jgi:hypothetical protein
MQAAMQQRGCWAVQYFKLQECNVIWRGNAKAKEIHKYNTYYVVSRSGAKAESRVSRGKAEAGAGGRGKAEAIINTSNCKNVIIVSRGNAEAEEIHNYKQAKATLRQRNYFYCKNAMEYAEATPRQ